MFAPCRGIKSRNNRSAFDQRLGTCVFARRNFPVRKKVRVWPRFDDNFYLILFVTRARNCSWRRKTKNLKIYSIYIYTHLRLVKNNFGIFPPLPPSPPPLLRSSRECFQIFPTIVSKLAADIIRKKKKKKNLFPSPFPIRHFIRRFVSRESIPPRARVGDRK